MPRPLILFHMLVKSFNRRLINDLATEITIAIASLCLAALFYYIFSDFLNSEIAAISTTMQERWGKTLTHTLLLGAGINWGVWLRKQNHQNSILQWAKHQGEKPLNLKLYYLLMLPASLLPLYGIPLLLTHYGFSHWQEGLRLTPIYLILGLAIANFPLNPPPPKTSNKTWYPSNNPSSSIDRWRRRLILRRRSTQISLTLSCLWTLALFLPKPGLHPLNFLLCLLAGLHIAFALAIQVAAELPAWIEKNAGIGHDLYLKSLLKSSWKLGSLGALAATIIYGSRNLSWNFDLISIFTITLCPTFIFPLFVFQIDPNRPLIQIMSITLAALFIGTAIYASPLAILLFPILYHYGLNSQQGRFEIRK